MLNARDIVVQDLDYIVANLEQEMECLAGRRLVITGGAGFLGYYLLHAIQRWNSTEERERRIATTVLDSFFRGVPAWIEGLATDPHFDIRRRDVTQPLPGDIAFDYIIHGASIASPSYYRRFPIQTMDANVSGLRHLLGACVGVPVSGMLFFSSSEIYGDPTGDAIPTPESYRGNVSCTGPRACYDESKRYGETLCVNFAKVHGVPVKVARPFNNYGPGLKISDRRALPDFARAILNGEDVVLFSDGTPTRTFCYIADAVIGYFKILVCGRSAEAYNIGVEAPEVSVRELAEKTVAIGRELFGYRGSVVFARSSDEHYLTDNPNRRCPSIAKAREELGYNPRVGLEEGLRRSLIWYAGNATGEDA